MLLIVEFGTLKQNFNQSIHQTWYFKKSLESKKKRMIDLSKKINEIKKTFNTTTLDTLINKINDNLEIKVHYEMHGMNSIQQMHYSFVCNENKFLNELIRLKSKIKLLRSIDYYIESPEESLVFFD